MNPSPPKRALKYKVSINQSVNQSINLANCATTKLIATKRYKAVTGYQKSKLLISAGRPNKYKVLHKIETDRCKDRETDRHVQTNLITNCKSNLYNKGQPNTTIIIH